METKARHYTALTWEIKAVELLKELAKSVEANEEGTIRYQLFQDRNQGEELVMIEQYALLSPFSQQCYELC